MSLPRRIRRRLLSVTGASLAAVLAVTGLTGLDGAAADDPTPTPVHTFDTRGDLDAPEAATAASERLRAAGAPPVALSPRGLCGASTAVPVVDGTPIVVSLPPAATFTVGALPAAYWITPPSKDAAWQMWFYSMRWAQGVVLRAYEDRQPASMTAVVDQVMRFYAQYPDRAGRTRLGWDEGSSLRRLETLNCVYSATRDPRLVTAMATEVRVLTGPRYYGPPNHSVHNHGLMTNQRMVAAGLLAGRADWVRIARSRMIREAPQAFTAVGTTFEQSSSYHQVNVSMWQNAAAMLGSLDPGDATPATIGRILAKARRVQQWLTEPDGRIVQLGDAGRDLGLRASARPVTNFRDTQAGLLIGRWSWTDPDTSYYTVRYGPPRWAHGHFDKASVTWSTQGTRVLVGPGYTTTPATSSAIPWHRLPIAHNTSAPVRGTFRPSATGLLRSSSHRGSVATAVVDESTFGVAHRRAVRVDDGRHTMSVSDSYPRGVANRQTWHLDPAWVLVSAPAGGTTLRFRHPSGRTLTVTTNGRLLSAVKGKSRSTTGWTYLSTTQRVPSYELTIASVSHAVSTTFTVR